VKRDREEREVSNCIILGSSSGVEGCAKEKEKMEHNRAGA